MAFCAHCGIRFLTHPGCAGRLNLRCPFGCRKHHRRQRSNQRSTAYYRTASGRAKKKQLNARRSSLRATVGGCEQPTQATEQADEQADQANERANEQADAAAISASEPLPDERSSQWELRLDGVILRASMLPNSPMLPYVRMIVRLIEGIQLSYPQLLQWLRQALRQHRLANRTRAEYVLRFLHQHPP